MTQIFSRWLPCVTLGTWSGVLLFYSSDSRMQNLLAPEFRHYALAAGIVLAFMAMAFALFKADASCCSANDCGHGLSRLSTGKILTFLVLIGPIVLAAKFNPESGFSATAVRNAITITDSSSLGQAPSSVAKKIEAASQPKIAPADLTLPSKDGSQLPPGPSGPPAESPSISQYLTHSPDGNIVAEVLDLIYAAQDSVLRKDFEGKKVELIAQLMPDTSNLPPTESGKRFKAVRMFMVCCAADARPVATMVEAPELPTLPEMTWIKITGTATFPVEKGRRFSMIQAEKVEKTEPPENAMLY